MITDADFNAWVYTVTNDGRTLPSSFSQFGLDYYKFIPAFKNAFPDYANTIASDLEPGAIFNVYNSSNCK